MFIVSKFLRAVFSLSPNLALPITNGQMKGVRWLANSANPGQVFGRYEAEHEAHFVSMLSNVDVLWDVGAHVGWYSLLAAKHLPSSSKIVSFEPSPRNLDYLKRHKDINSASNMRIENIALSDKVGTARFSNKSQQSQLSDSGEYEVRTITADAYLSGSNVAPDFIKLDIEGAETSFLRGAKNLLEEYAPRILLSAHGFKKRDECVDILVEAGYETTHIVSNSVEGDYVLLATPSKKINGSAQ